MGGGFTNSGLGGGLHAIDFGKETSLIPFEKVSVVCIIILGGFDVCGDAAVVE